MERNQFSPIGTTIGTKFASSKSEFEARSAQLRDISHAMYIAVFGIRNPDGSWKQRPTHGLFDTTILAAKSVSGMASFDDMFKSDDDEATGLASLANGKPAANEPTLVTEISLQYAVAAGTSKPDVAKASYGLIHDYMRNGRIEIAQEKRLIVTEQVMEPFHVADHYQNVGDTNAVAGTPIIYTSKGIGNVGRILLANPKWIEPEKKIDVDMKFADALPADSAIRILLHGVKPMRV